MTELSVTLNKEKRRTRIGVFVLVLLVAIVVAFVSTDLHTFFTLQNLRVQQQGLATLIQLHPILSVSTFAFLYITAVVLSLPIATVLTLASGFLFGTALGAVVVVIAATIGATIIFTLARYFFHDWFFKKFGAYSSRLENHLGEHAFSYILFLRIVPLFPFFLVNIALAFTRIRIRDYVLATLIGIIPGTVVYVLAGERLSVITDGSPVLSSENIAVLVLLSGIALLPVGWKHITRNKFVTNT